MSITLVVAFIIVFIFGFLIGQNFTKTDGAILIEKIDEEDAVNISFGLKNIPNKKYIKLLNVKNKNRLGVD